ncbi:hypothetical protein SEA_MUFASA8_33 [Arthrobacter phage Mufasa8]|uniref:Uncharacterized protein n=1 Tax=Arthrobacter phage Mufasa8 TaxID=2656526 RepID=A0A649VNG3_9CAUD|nr:hypothetical protein HYQ08_gp033 [Arthrobacter phage Mufasa8]QGJ93482.1 hypothetical protein SEA_MUFASA8_33 [Arthrobacter phage Mufasa8]
MLHFSHKANTNQGANMQTYNINLVQSEYLTNLSQAARNYKDTLAEVQRYVERELEYMAAGRFDHGRHHQLIGELGLNKQVLQTTLEAWRYTMADMDATERENLLKIAMGGTEFFFAPAES